MKVTQMADAWNKMLYQ